MQLGLPAASYNCKYIWPTARPGPAWHAMPPGPCLTGPWPCPSVQARSYVLISVSGRSAKHDQNHGPCQPMACYPLHSQTYNGSHSQSQITESKFHNSYIHSSHHHSFLHSQNQSPKLQMSDTVTVSYIHRIEVQISDTFTYHSFIHSQNQSPKSTDNRNSKNELFSAMLSY